MVRCVVLALLLALSAAFVLTAAVAMEAPPQADTTDPIFLVNTPTEKILNVPARRMWGWGPNVRGYCGECSIQTAAIFLGNYLSQERVRYADGNRELLIGVNDAKAARALLFNVDQWGPDTHGAPQIDAFVSWATRHIDQGHAVIAGWYEKQPDGDPDYDHIMPIVGYNTTTATSGSVRVAGLYYQDLYLNATRYADASSQIGVTRKVCSQRSEPSQPYTYCLPKQYDYGIALLSNFDKSASRAGKEGGEPLLRTILTMSNWSEPDWGSEDKLHQKPVPMTVTLTVVGTTAGQRYAVLRYDTAKAVPSNGTFWESGGWSSKIEFTATSAMETLTDADTIMSDGTFFYRTVRVPS